MEQHVLGTFSSKQIAEAKDYWSGTAMAIRAMNECAEKGGKIALSGDKLVLTLADTDEGEAK